MKIEKLTPRKLTKDELDELSAYLTSEDDDLSTNRAKEELNNSTILAFDTPSNKVFIVRIYFLGNIQDGTLDKIVEEYIMHEDFSVEEAKEIDII